MPMKVAARQLELGVSSMKTVCRTFGIRWPSRKLQCIVRLRKQVGAWGGEDTSGLTEARLGLFRPLSARDAASPPPLPSPSSLPLASQPSLSCTPRPTLSPPPWPPTTTLQTKPTQRP